MNISPIKINSPSFSMKFSPEIEEKYLLHLHSIKDEDKKQNFIALKQKADMVLNKLPYNDNIKYGCVVRKNGKDYFRHSINLKQECLKLSPDDTNNIELFFGFFLWNSLKEFFEIFPTNLLKISNSRRTSVSLKS